MHWPFLPNLRRYQNKQQREVLPSQWNCKGRPLKAGLRSIWTARGIEHQPDLMPTLQRIPTLFLLWKI